MHSWRLLPWEYGVRNLLRRPSRTALTLLALAVVVLLVLVIVSMVRGLEHSLTTSGDPEVVLVYALGADVNVESSAISAQVPGILAANLPEVRKDFGVAHVSPELYLGTRINVEGGHDDGLGLVRGVTATAPLVRRQVRIVEGHWPQSGEVLVGQLVEAKLGCAPGQLAVGSTLEIERKTWRISGRFNADGGAFDSEIWCLLPDLQQALQRQDVTLVALLLKRGAAPSDVEIFCKQRVDLELQAIAESAYYALIQQHYGPMRWVAWMVAALVSGAGVFAGLNLMYGAVAGRVRELATLQAIGYRRRAIVVSLVQEGILLAATSSIIASGVALFWVHGAAVRFTMGAFALWIDGGALLIGCGVGVLLGALGAIPPALKILRVPIVEGLKSV